MTNTAAPASVAVLLVSTKIVVMSGDKPALDANDQLQYAWVRRFMHPDQRERAEADVAEGRAAGVEKELQEFSLEQLPKLPFKLRMQAYAAAGLQMPNE